MSGSQKWALLFGMLMGGVLIFCYLALNHDPRKLPSVLIGRVVPSLHWEELDRPEKKHVLSELKGHWLVLNWWASWCMECRAEHTLLLNLKKKHEDVQWIGINYKDVRADAQAYLKSLGDPYQISLQDPSGDRALDLGVYGVPETFLVDPKGVIRWRWAGPLDEASFEEQFKKESGL